MDDPIVEEGSHNIVDPSSNRGQIQGEKRWRPWGGWSRHRRARMEEEACQRRNSLKKKFKFEESKSSGKVDTTDWVVPAGCKPDSKTCRGWLKKQGQSL